MLTDCRLAAKPRVLAIDDREENLLAFKAILREVDCEYIGMPSGEEALRYLRDERVALLLIDLRMPVVDGFAFAERLKEIPLAAGTPFFFLTASDPSLDIIEKAYSFGAADFLTKPVPPTVLLSKVRYFLELFSSREEKRALTSNRSFLETDGEMSRLFREKDWSKTPLGAVELWPQSLRTLVGSMLRSTFPTFISWGEHRVFLYNDAYRPILGSEKHPRALGSHFQQVWHEIWNDLGPVADEVDRGKASYFEDRPLYMNRSGYFEQTYFTFSYSPILDESDQIRGLLCTCVETTGRKKTELALRESEDRFRVLMNSIPQIVWTAQPDGSAEYFNEWWYQFTGWNYEQSIGWSWKPLIHPDDRESSVEKFVEAVQAGRPFENEHRFLRASDQSWRWHLVRAIPLKNDEGAIVKWVGVAIDIHDRKLEGERARLIVETIPQGIWRTNPDGSADYCTERFYELVGYTAEEFLGWGWTQFIHPEDRARVVTEWEKSRSQKQSVSVDFRIVAKNGSHRWFLSLGAPFFDERGELTKYYGTWTDITERKRAEKELRDAKEQAEKANELKTAFLANMSHEIRTPLGAMIGFADLLRDPSLSESEKVSYIDILHRNGEQLGHIINDILDLSKVETGHLHFELLRVKPKEIAREVVSLLDVLAKEKGLRLEFEAGPEAPDEIITDPTRLRQILTNLVSNALKFTRQGLIHIKLSGHESETGVRCVAFDVTDTGIGIPEESVDRLFKMFTQADSSMTRKFGGTGLGLALSRSLARALGGDVKLVRSKKNEGSTFRVVIESRAESELNHVQLLSKSEGDPLESGPPNVFAKGEVKKDVPKLKDIRVLLVEDSPDNQQLIRRYLSKQGAEVEIAENGLEGVSKALAGNHDIVLMDLQMPIMDGYTATGHLRARGFLKPIIALTAHAMSDVKDKCTDVGCSGHLPKPVNPGELTSAVARFVAERG